jgi:hypothetical protein
MGKRSGVPHRSDELNAMRPEDVAAEIETCRSRLRFATSASQAKHWRKRLHWLEKSLQNRD